MKQYNILQAIVMSFYSKNLYRDVAKNWGGKAFLYLFLFLKIDLHSMDLMMQMVIQRVRHF